MTSKYLPQRAQSTQRKDPWLTRRATNFVISVRSVAKKDFVLAQPKQESRGGA